MRWYLFTLPLRAWKNRKIVRSQENYSVFVRECSESKAVAERVQNGQQAGPYPEGPGSGWRYQCKRLPMHDELQKAYDLEEIAGQGDTFTRALRVMGWLTAHTWYCGMSFWSGSLPDNGLKILRYAYDNPFRHAINCRHKAYALADCLVAIGIAAIPVCIINEGYCHLVVHVWLPEERRWVMLDPSFDSYITDETGRALNLFEIHDCRRRGEALNVPQYNFNGTQDCRESYLEHFVLCSLWEISTYNSTGSKQGDSRNALLPEGVASKDNKLRSITATELLAEPIIE